MHLFNNVVLAHAMIAILNCNSFPVFRIFAKKARVIKRWLFFIPKIIEKGQTCWNYLKMCLNSIHMAQH